MDEREGYKYTFFTRDVQWAIVATLFFIITSWFIWIVYLVSFYKYIRLKTIKLKGYRKEPIKKIDRRFKDGYKVTGYVNKTFYQDFLATDSDLKRNKKKAYFFLIMAVLNLILAIPIYVSLFFL